MAKRLTGEGKWLQVSVGGSRTNVSTGDTEAGEPEQSGGEFRLCGSRTRVVTDDPCSDRLNPAWWFCVSIGFLG